MLLVFETVVVWFRKMNFSILRTGTRISLYGCCTGATRVYGCYTGGALPKSTFVSARSQTTSYQNSTRTESLLLCLRNFLCFYILKRSSSGFGKTIFRFYAPAHAFPVYGRAEGLGGGLGYGISPYHHPGGNYLQLCYQLFCWPQNLFQQS